MMTLSLLLVLAVGQEDPDVKQALDTYASVAERLASPDPDEREAARTLLDPAMPRAKAGLKKHLAAEDPTAPVAAILLALTGEKSARSYLLLKNEHVVLRRNALEGLAAIKPSEGTSDLLKLLEDPDLGVRVAAARALGAHEGKGVSAELQKRLPKAPAALAPLLHLALDLREPGSQAEALSRLVLEGAGEARNAAIAAALNAPAVRDALARTWEPGQGGRPGHLKMAGLLPLFAGDIDEETRPLLGALLMRTRVLFYADLFPHLADAKAGVPAAALRLIATNAKRWRAVLLGEGIAALAKANKDVRDGLENLIAEACGFRAADAAKYAEWWSKNKRPVIDAEADPAIAAGVAFLRSIQQKDGSWKFCDCRDPSDATREHTLGTTALTLYTLLKCDVPADDPAIERAAEFVLAGDVATLAGGAQNYTASCMLMALSELHQRAKPPKTAKSRATVTFNAKLFVLINPKIQLLVNWLVDAQGTYEKGGYEYGPWTYGKSVPIKNADGTTTLQYDQSNTQFAILGLRAAANVGVTAPTKTWQKALNHYLLVQCDDGGWFYTPPAAGQKGAGWEPMCAAGVASVLMLKATLTKKTTEEVAATDEAAKKGIEWCVKKFALAARSRDPNQMVGHVFSPFYNLYSLERAMMLSGLKMLGERDWYAEGAYWIFLTHRRDGSWIDVTDTDFALLFLKRAYVDVATPGGGK